MLIRSQDGILIINLDNVNEIYIHDNSKYQVLRLESAFETEYILTNEESNQTSKEEKYYIYADETLIGFYSTKEKAIKVLDMITGEYKKTSVSFHGYARDVMSVENYPKVFKMPLDEEF